MISGHGTQIPHEVAEVSSNKIPAPSFGTTPDVFLFGGAENRNKSSTPTFLSVSCSVFFAKPRFDGSAQGLMRITRLHCGKLTRYRLLSSLKGPFSASRSVFRSAEFWAASSHGLVVSRMRAGHEARVVLAGCRKRIDELALFAACMYACMCRQDVCRKTYMGFTVALEACHTGF